MEIKNYTETQTFRVAMRFRLSGYMPTTFLLTYWSRQRMPTVWSRKGDDQPSSVWMPPGYASLGIIEDSLCSEYFSHAVTILHLDYLYWRGKEQGAEEENMSIFPWVFENVSEQPEARNRKVFENVSEQPEDILELATQEEEAWTRANTKEDSTDSSGGGVREVSLPRDIPLCYTDGSWHSTDPRSGQGWIITSGGKMQHIGLKGSRRCLSLLHTELKALVWAMQCLLANSYSDIMFLTDCSDLIKITTSP